MKEIVYRSQYKSETELKDDFVIRLLEFRKLMNSIKTDQPGKTPQHIILLGQHGMGKTTLIYRVYYQVLNDHRKTGLVPVVFGDEQYSIRTLNKLWEQTARFLEDYEPDYSGISYQMQDMQDLEDYDEKCFELLSKSLKKNRHRLLLMIENFGVMVDKFTKQEQQRFREILITFPGIKIIGGSAVVPESFYKYDNPFYDYFKIMQLEPLNSFEVKTLLLRLGEKHKTKHIKEIVETQPGRIESIRILTGGVPRTIVMLFNIFLDSDHGNSIEDLNKLLDIVTPLYKHRMDELSVQQQEIVDKLALYWDGMSVSELVRKTRMESKAISAQLNNLVKSGVVHAEKSTGKNKFYQLEERFFNIWYLMQYAPGYVQQKVIWLTRFLEYWCHGKGLEDDVLREPDKAYLKAHDTKSNLINIRHLLLTDESEKATALLEEIMPEALKDEDHAFLFSDLLAFAIAKGLKQYVLKLFQQDEYQLKDRFKVLYYALMKILEDEYPNEIRKMGKELEEPVNNMVGYIKKLDMTLDPG